MNPLKNKRIAVVGHGEVIMVMSAIELQKENERLKSYLQHLFDSYSDQWTNAEIERFEKVMSGKNPF